MSDLTDKCLDTFPKWLRSLGEDVEAVLAVAEVDGLDDGARRQLVAGINYLFKSLDLIPDGIDDIGYLDDAFVVRVSANLVEEKGMDGVPEDTAKAIKTLSEDVALVKEFLGDETYDRLIRYTVELKKGAARGRAVDDIVTSPDVFREFSSEVRSFAKGYECPSFAREEKNLIKLRAFFVAKLPR